MSAFRSSFGEYRLASKTQEDKVLDEIGSSDSAFNMTLYRTWSKGLMGAVNRVFGSDDRELAGKLRQNVSKFAAAKALDATLRVKSQQKDELKRSVLHAHNRYFSAEYNTAVSRSRTAKQFADFMQDDNVRLFPNLRWLPSRSVSRREAHIPFYNRVWAKDDPFWSKNQPGNLWNCKCDWEETGDRVTDGNPDVLANSIGLEGNPAQTGQVFTDSCSYVKNVQRLWSIEPRNKGILAIDRKRMPDNGTSKNDRSKYGKELHMCEVVADNGHFVEFRQEVDGEFDIYLDGLSADLKKTNSDNNIKKYMKKATDKQGAEIVVLELEIPEESRESAVKRILYTSDKYSIHGYYYFSDEKLLYEF